MIVPTHPYLGPASAPRTMIGYNPNEEAVLTSPPSQADVFVGWLGNGFLVPFPAYLSYKFIIF